MDPGEEIFPVPAVFLWLRIVALARGPEAIREPLSRLTRFSRWVAALSIGIFWSISRDGGSASRVARAG